MSHRGVAQPSALVTPGTEGLDGFIDDLMGLRLVGVARVARAALEHRRRVLRLRRPLAGVREQLTHELKQSPFGRHVLRGAPVLIEQGAQLARVHLLHIVLARQHRTRHRLANISRRR